MARLTALTTLFLSLLSAAGFAQEPDRRFEGRIEVSEVLFDVVVTDKKGNIVTGLGVDDFEVKAAGRKSAPTSVAFYSTGYGPGTAAEQIPASRYFIFFFHDQRLANSPESGLMRQQLLAGKQSIDWIESDMGPSDWIAVVSYDVKLKIHQDFTQDRAQIVRAIGEATQGGDPEQGRARRRTEADHTEASLLRRLPSGIDLRNETKNIYDGMTLLAEASRHIVGRKNLLLFSIGFGEVQRQPIALPDRRYYPALEEALNANNVAVYPIDLTQQNAEHVQSHFLSTLASDTGGAYTRHFTSFLTPLRRVGRESSGYYLLAYREEHRAGESGYKAVEIRTRDKRLVVRAPQGYRYGGD